MIKAEVIFEDDYIVLNGKDIWLDCESMYFAVGDYSSQIAVEMVPSQELAIRYCLRNKV